MINHIGREVRALLRLDHLPRQPRRIRKRQIARLKEKPSAAGVPEPICLNCGTRLEGVYCPACGQRDDDLRRPVWSFLADFGDTLFEVDSRIYLTLLPLIFMPGWVTRKFIDGKRARFVPPVRMFLVSSVVFFLVVSVADVAIMKFEFVPEGEDGNVRVHSTADAEKAADLRASALDELKRKREAALADDSLSEAERQHQLEAFDLAENAIGAADDSFLLTLSKADRQDASGESTSEIGGEGEAQAETRSIEMRNGALFSVTDSDADSGYSLNIDMFVPLGDEGATPIPEGALDSLNIQAGSAKLNAFFERVVEGLKRSASEPRRLNNTFNTWIPRGMILLLPIFALFLRSLYWSKQHYLLNQVIFSLHFHTFIFLLMTFLVAAQAVWGGGVSGGLFFIVIPLYLLIAMKVVFQQGWFRTILKFCVFSFFYMIAFWIAVFGVVVWSLYEV